MSLGADLAALYRTTDAAERERALETGLVCSGAWRPALDRLCEKFVPEPNSGCWLWTGAVSRFGYGQIRAGHRMWPAHRLMYVILVGPVADDLVMDHLCRNPACVNPAHLEPVPQRTNLRRGSGFVGKKARQTHCGQGHELAGVNLYVTSDGRRKCRTCARMFARELRARVAALRLRS